jgi:protein CpxP
MTRIRSLAATMLLAAIAMVGGDWAGALGPADAAAQPPRAGRERPARPDGRFGPAALSLPEELELTEEQKAQVEKIRADLMEKNRPLMEQLRSVIGEPEAGRGERMRGGREMQRLTPEQREKARPILEQIRANHQAAYEQVLALLTPEQKEKLEKLRAERAERARGRGLRGQRGPGPDRGATPPRN